MKDWNSARFLRASKEVQENEEEEEKAEKSTNHATDWMQYVLRTLRVKV